MNVNYDILPEHMQDGARRYVEQHLMPGMFLRCVLANDFVNAFLYADPENELNLHLWAKWVSEEAPLDSWGSYNKVLEWVEGGAK